MQAIDQPLEMDVTTNPAPVATGDPIRLEGFRRRVQSFLSDSLPAEWAGVGALSHGEHALFVGHWREALRKARLLAVEWPEEIGGGGLSLLEQMVMAEEFTKAGVPYGSAADTFGIMMLGNVLLDWGTEDQRLELLPRILSGQDVWCQGFSEPDAGSDLARLSCRAVLDGDRWVINGQKIWSSYAHVANKIFLLTRTSTGERPHYGITFLLVTLDQPGVEVRPITMLTGESNFNEVFFTNAECPAGAVVGEIGGGWRVAMSILGFERGGQASVLWLQFQAELDRLIALARQRGLSARPLIRQRIARCYVDVQIMRYLGLRSMSRYLAGEEPGALGAMSKVQWSEYHQRLTDLSMNILGMDALVPIGRRPSKFAQGDDIGAPNDSASWVGTFLNARASTIYGGTSQIQRTVLAEQVLGLPREPRTTEGAGNGDPVPTT